MRNGIFIASTGQNVGKTTICLGLLAALKKRFGKLGFIKPVGQQHITLDSGVVVDKDVLLFHEFFSLESSWEDMSPVIIPPGLTRDYLNGLFDSSSLKETIRSAYDRIANESDFTIAEGTGHAGVGSILDLNNADVAKELGLDMLLIASGGLGSSFDELALNLEVCRSKGVNVRGVILNRVLPEKREMILEYYPKALKKWDIPLIGTIPYSSFLSTPTMEDFCLLFHTDFIAGSENRLRHFQDKRLVASSLEAYQAEMAPNELIITPASRSDIIDLIADNPDLHAGLILTGRHPPSPETIEKIKGTAIPTLYAPMCSYEAMKKITSFIAKIRKEDKAKVEKAIELVEHNIEFPVLCQKQN